MTTFDAFLQRVLRQMFEQELRANLQPLLDEFRKEIANKVAERVADAPRMNAAEVAELAGVAPKTVLRWARRGELSSERAGRLVRFRRAEVEAFLRKGADRTEAVDVSKLAEKILERRVGTLRSRRSK